MKNPIQRNMCELYRILAVPFVALLSVSSGCQVRLSNAGLESSETSRTGLDVMDTAVLYPPPGGNEVHAWPRFLFRRERQEYSSIKQDFARDQAILGDLSSRGFWPKVFSDKYNLMPKPVFDQIIETGQGRPPELKGAGINYILKALSSPSDRRGQQATEYDLSVNMAEADRWRVASFRFDPCPYSVVHGLPAREDDDAGANKQTTALSNRARLCQPEFRLVVQPFLGKKDYESQIGATLPFIGALGSMGGNPTGVPVNSIPGRGRGWFAADYAIHLFYRLTREQASEMAEELLSLREKYRTACPTSGMPMQVHPCLVFEALNVGKPDNVTFADDLLAIYAKRADGLHKAAIWGSRVNASPWTFFAGNIVTDASGTKRFETARIRPLDAFSFDNEDDRAGTDSGEQQSSNPNSSRAKSASDKAEKLATASLLTQRKAMFFDRNTGFPNTVFGPDGTRYYANLTTYRKRRINPPPLPGNDSLAVFVMGNVGFQNSSDYSTIINTHNYRLGLASVPNPKNRYEDVLKVTARIENPILNNEFRVDCASCHMANMEASNARMLIRSEIRKNFGNGVPFATAYLQATKADASLSSSRIKTAPPDALYPADYYWSPQGLSAFRTVSSTLSPKGTRAMVYMINQFSFYLESRV